jgi:hypothetical protein
MPKKMVVETNVDTVQLSQVSGDKFYVAEGDGYNVWLQCECLGEYCWLDIYTMSIKTWRLPSSTSPTIYLNRHLSEALQFAIDNEMTVYQFDRLSEIQEFIAVVERRR